MLLQEINVLRKDVHDLQLKLGLIGLMQQNGDNGSTQRSQQMGISIRSGEKEQLNDMQKELKMQDIQISELQKQIQELEEQNEMLRAQRPRVNKLPPLEHMQQQHHP